jgi:hypothetical protein
MNEVKYNPGFAVITTVMVEGYRLLFLELMLYKGTVCTIGMGGCMHQGHLFCVPLGAVSRNETAASIGIIKPSALLYRKREIMQLGPTKDPTKE